MLTLSLKPLLMASSALSKSRQAIITLAPQNAKARVHSKPIPQFAPVITATLLLKSLPSITS